jgi:hypothetical protein
VIPEIFALLVYCQNAAGRVIGAKPATMCRWIFTLLGACPGDTLDDLFPGSDAVGRALVALPDRPTRSLEPHRDAFAYRGSVNGALILVPGSSDRRLRRRLRVV